MSTRPISVLFRLGFTCLAASISSAATLTVTNTTDVVNGDTSSPAALIARPGPDGISFREAMTAINGAPGPHTITFDASLAGKTIVLTGEFGVDRDGIAIVGIPDASGRPSVTLDVGSAHSVLNVRASDFTLSGIRIVDFPGNRGFGITAGDPGAPLEVSNITIEGNEFSNEGLVQTSRSNAIEMQTRPGSTGARLLNVRIAGNTFTDLQAESDGVLIEGDGNGSVVSGVTISGNTFANVTFGTELVSQNASSCRIEDTQITGNTFTANDQPVNINQFGPSSGPPSSGNVIDLTEIANNFFAGTRATNIMVIAGAGNASENAITNTRIVNNVITGGAQSVGVRLIGSNPGGMNGRVDGVEVVNNTIAGTLIGFFDTPDFPGTGGGTVVGVKVINSLFSANSADFQGDTSLIAVSHCITDDATFIGANGDFSADPLFVDLANGDFHLRASSPAIGKGTLVGAPCMDFDGLARLTDGEVDIGAYEFGAVFSPRPCPITPLTPPRVVHFPGRG